MLMTALGKFITKGRSQAILVISTSGLLAFVLFPLAPVLLLLSCATLVLVVLRNNTQYALTVLVIALAVSAGIPWLVGLEPLGLGLGAMWLMVFLSAQAFRRSGNLAIAVFAALVTVVLAVLLFVIWVRNPIEWWQPWVVKFIELADIESVAVDQIRAIAKLLTGAFAATLLIVVVASLLVGVWWQSRLQNSGQFRRDFQQLRLGKVLSIVAALLLVAAIVTDSALFIALSAPTLVIYMFQGLAVIHAFAGQQAGNNWWLVTFYIFLILFRQLVILVSLMGIVDAWLDSRRRWLKPKPSQY